MKEQYNNSYYKKKFALAIPNKCGKSINFKHIEGASFTKVDQVSGHSVWWFYGKCEPRVFRIEKIRCSIKAFENGVRLLY